jgi:hypothetical protein
MCFSQKRQTGQASGVCAWHAVQLGNEQDGRPDVARYHGPASHEVLPLAARLALSVLSLVLGRLTEEIGQFGQLADVDAP